MLEDGRGVTVNKGFIHIKTYISGGNVQYYCSPFKSSSRCSKTEVDYTRRLVSARIYIDREIEQFKNFRILQSVLPISLSDMAG